MKKIFIILLSLYTNLCYSMNENEPKINRFVALPIELQDHIAQFIPFNWLETDEETIAALDQQQCVFPEQSFETRNYKISIDKHTGNVTYLDKKNDTFEDLIRVDNSYRKTKAQSPAIFALSPNRKRGVLETSHLFINTENNKQNNLLIANLETKQTHFLNVSPYFLQRIVQVVAQFQDYYVKNEFIEINASKGYPQYQGLSHFYELKLLFSTLAISNDGLIAVVDKSNLSKYQQPCINLLDQQKNSCIQLDHFNDKIIKSMRFNAQGTKLFVKLQNNDSSELIKSYTIKELEKPACRKSLIDYFHNKAVCNRERFFNNNIPDAN